MLFGVGILPFCSGMRSGIDALDLLEGSMGIDLGGRDRGVTEERLDGTNIRTVIEHGGCKGMTQDVRGVFFEGRDRSHTRAHDSI